MILDEDHWPFSTEVEEIPDEDHWPFSTKAEEILDEDHWPFSTEVEEILGGVHCFQSRLVFPEGIPEEIPEEVEVIPSAGTGEAGVDSQYA